MDMLVYAAMHHLHSDDVIYLLLLGSIHDVLVHKVCWHALPLSVIHYLCHHYTRC